MKASVVPVNGIKYLYRIGDGIIIAGVDSETAQRGGAENRFMAGSVSAERGFNALAYICTAVLPGY